MSSDPRSFRIDAEPGVSLALLEWNEESASSQADASDEAPPIVLMHGGGANSHWWDEIAAPLARDHRVIAFDFRGHGDSSYPQEHRIGAFNDDLEAVARWLGREDLILVGHSLGAAVALDHASRHPATRGLILVDLARGTGTAPRRRARLALSFRRTYRSRDEAIERFQFLPESRHAPESRRESVARHSILEEADGRFGYKFDPAWFGLPSRPRPDLARLATPTLLVRGSESELLSREAADAFVAKVRNARLTEIEAAGHHVLIDQPEALLEEIRRFLRRLGAKTGSSEGSDDR
jgi:pimeloyl-ACP methyl ester carboxylesterase